MLRRQSLLIAGLLPALLAPPGFAAEDWSLCRLPSFVFVAADDLAAGETRLEAQTIVSEDKESIRLTGDVTVDREQQRIQADEMRFDKDSEEINARGNVFFTSPDYYLSSPEVRIDNLNDLATFKQPDFSLRNSHARGQASKIEKLDQYRTRYRDLSYTSCDPDDRDWHLRASKLLIDQESGRGTATHARLYFKEIPFLYLPYFQFPVDDRRMSGMLTPTIGYDEIDGTTLIVPVYWNIAPNYDMTITPSSYANRGLQLNTENRYLLESQSGQIDLSYLDDSELDDTRWFKQWRHNAALGADIKAEILLAEVSDRDFFDDFKTIAPGYNDTEHLERRVSFRRSGDLWQSELIWQDYQTIDDSKAITSRPYNSLPRISLSADPDPLIANIETPLELEWVSFDRDDSVTGERSHVVTSAAWTGQESWYFFKPELQLAFTNYRLQDNPEDNSIWRGIPTFSADTGLIFERLAGSENQWLQTLEPRLYFLHTPFEDQDDIPDFDTSLSSSTYSNLFRNNRFTGADRIGDANQVTFGLSSRIFDNDSGDELLNARAGRIFYFKDRRVSLNGITEEATRSDVISELDIWPNPRVKIAARLVYDEDQSELSDKDLSIGYSDQGFAANLGYYFAEDDLEQALISMVYPLNERWTVMAKMHRSLQFEQPVENLLGFSYESCCWGFKILAGQTGDDDEDFSETDTSIYFEITFKGLSQAGQDIDAQLRAAIPGYTPAF